MRNLYLTNFFNIIGSFIDENIWPFVDNFILGISFKA